DEHPHLQAHHRQAGQHAEPGSSRPGRRPASRSGIATFCAAVSDATRLKLWKTNPTGPRRISVSSASEAELISRPAIITWPSVTFSSPAAQCSSVDFPEPDGPMTAVHDPGANATSTL